MNNNSSGITLDVVLLVIFVTLKLVGVIDWSWIWVLSPIWIGTIISVIGWVLLLHIKY